MCRGCTFQDAACEVQSPSCRLQTAALAGREAGAPAALQQYQLAAAALAGRQLLARPIYWPMLLGAPVALDIAVKVNPSVLVQDEVPAGQEAEGGSSQPLIDAVRRLHWRPAPAASPAGGAPHAEAPLPQAAAPPRQT